jgi:hypothetical protein
VHFDSTLNLVWAGLGLAALMLMAWIDYRNQGFRPFRSRLLRFIGVSLVVAALFPYISATDDMLQIEHVAAAMGGHEKQSTQHQHLNDLLRLYDTIDNSLMTHGCSFSLALVFFFLVVNPVFERCERSTPNFGGRSPPIAVPV